MKTANCLFILVIMLLSLTVFSCGGEVVLNIPLPSLHSIEITPVNPTIQNGYNYHFTATGIYSDISSQDITTSVAWSSSNTSVATISNVAGSNGLAATVGSGSATITATSGSISGSTTVTVTSAILISIAVTPTSPSITTGYKQQFTATGTFSDNSLQDMTASVAWSSSNTSAATISNVAGSNGLAAAVGGGATTITATSGSISGSTTLTVTAIATVDMWQTFDFPTLNTTNLAANAHTTLGSWNIDNDGDASTSTSGEKTAPAVFNGVSDSAGSEGLAYENNGTAYRHGTVQYVFDTYKTSFTTGFWLYVPSGMTGLYGEHDVLCISTVNSGTDTYLKLGDPTGTEMRLRSFIFYTSNNTGYYSTEYVTLPQNAWYWIAVDYRNNDTVVVDVYDSSLAFVGSVNHASDGATPDDEIFGMWIGSLIGASESGMSGTIYWDDWVINWTNPKHPIGLVGDTP